MNARLLEIAKYLEKVALGALLITVLTVVYFTILLPPLRNSCAQLRKKIAEGRQKLAQAHAQIARTEQLEAKAPVAAARRKLLAELAPNGDPLAWYPMRLSKPFKESGIDQIVVRQNAVCREKAIKGFNQSTWVVEIPEVEFPRFCTALSAFEQTEALSNLSQVSIEISRAQPGVQGIRFAVTNLIKQ